VEEECETLSNAFGKTLGAVNRAQDMVILLICIDRLIAFSTAANMRCPIITVIGPAEEVICIGVSLGSKNLFSESNGSTLNFLKTLQKLLLAV
jgi:hypothetical protein